VFKVEFLPLINFLDIHREYIRMNNQMENTCGTYALTYILRALGYREHEGIEISEDYLAYLARTRISPEEEKTREEAITKLLYGEEKLDEILRKYGKVMYRYELIVTDKPSELGTSAIGIKYALETVTKGELVGLPIPSRHGNEIYFTEENFKRLVELLISKIYEWKYQAILNLQTNLLINSLSPYHDIFTILFTNNAELSIGPNPWYAGHFISLAGFIRVIDKNSERIYFLLRDTYKNIGCMGYHIQPLSNIRKALVRNDGREGGILLIVHKDLAPDVENTIRKLGLKIDLWDNGTPF